jgi:hypothetical protein
LDSNKNKKIAAITGVLYYLKNEEQENKNISRQDLTHMSSWASYNRQSIMNMRSLMQKGQFRKKN